MLHKSSPIPVAIRARFLFYFIHYHLSTSYWLPPFVNYRVTVGLRRFLTIVRYQKGKESPCRILALRVPSDLLGEDRKVSFIRFNGKV